MKGKRGANLIYVVILVALLGILAAAYSSMLIHSARSAARQREEIQTHYTDKTLLTAYVATLTEDENEAFDALLDEANADWKQFLKDFQEWQEKQESNNGNGNNGNGNNGNGNGPGSNNGQGGGNGTDGNEGNGNGNVTGGGELENAPIFKNYMKPPYEATGEGSLPNGEGTLTVKMAYAPAETGEETLKITLTREKDGKTYTTGALLTQTRQPADDPDAAPELNDWKVVRYYEK